MMWGGVCIAGLFLVGLYIHMRVQTEKSRRHMYLSKSTKGGLSDEREIVLASRNFFVYPAISQKGDKDFRGK